MHDCAGCNTYVHLSMRSCSKASTTVSTAAAQLLPKLASFASWLPKHGPLVRSLNLWEEWQRYK